MFAKLPQLVERAGNGMTGGGSITAFYTVLTEGDDQQDPIADAARAILDGHIVLSRDLADQGHYPAIDIEQSVSRAMHALVDDATLDRVKRFKQLYSRYRRNRDLISVGAYSPGSDPLLDRAISLHPQIEAFLQQNMRDSIDLASSAGELARIVALTSTGAHTTMAEARQLTFLEKLEADKSDAQAVALAKARQALNAAEAQLAQLKAYESSYHGQLSDKLEDAITVDLLRGHHRFMQNIAQAVRQQEVEVARRRANADALQRVWQEIERRRQAFRVLAEKAALASRRGEDRRIQKSSDEFAARGLLRSNIGL